MQIDKLSIVLRPRDTREALDLGVRIIGHWFQSIYRIWLFYTLPTCLGLFALFSSINIPNPYILLIIWWLLPLFDRVLLFILSHTIFGHTPTLKESILHIPELIKKTNLLRALTWGRFSFERVLHLPIDVLEQLNGMEAFHRRQLISNKDQFAVILLSFFSLMIQVIFALSLILLFQFSPINSLGGDFSKWLTNVFQLSSKNLLICIAVLLFYQPFHVAMGFSLYLKRRNELEAWDVEVSLIKMAETHEKKERESRLLLFPLLFIVSLFLNVAPIPASADNSTLANSKRELAIESAPENLQQLLRQPEFGGKIEKRELRWRNVNYFNPQTTSRSVDEENPIISIAQLARIIVWIGIFVLIGFIIHNILKTSHIKSLPPIVRREPLVKIAGVDVRRESLPDNIAEISKQLIAQEQHRAALSLLFRGALSVLAHRDKIPFNNSDTEVDCINRVREYTPEYADYFSQLTQFWLLQAYADKTPDHKTLLQLCQIWPAHFRLMHSEET